jgi:iduronate 2-sulfatase
VDRLAKAGTVFEHAYCQIAVCSPSRMSFLSGRRPGTSGIYNFKNHIRQVRPPRLLLGRRGLD